MDEPRFPHVSVKFLGEDGNAFMIMSRVRAALRRAGASQSDIAEFGREAMSGDYRNLLATVARWVTVDDEEAL